MATQSSVHLGGAAVNNKVKLCLWVFIQTCFHRRVTVGFVPFFSPSDAGNTAEGNWCGRYQSKPLCLEDTGPAWLPGPFMETVLGLIIPSCASSPSPAGLCVPVSSESAPHSHRSQGETRGEACTHRACI